MPDTEGPSAAAHAARPFSSLSWSAVDEMEMQVRRLGLPLQLLQLEGGPLGGGAVVTRVGPLHLMRLRMDRRLHAWGPKPPGALTISLDLNPHQPTAPLRAHGHPLPSACLFGLDSRREVHLTVPASVELGVVVMPLELLSLWAGRLGGADFDPQEALRANVLRVDSDRWGDLRGYLRQIFALAARDPSPLGTAAAQRLVLEDLLPLLVEALIHGSNQGGRLQQPPNRIAIVKAAQQLLHDHSLEPITLAELCRQIHVSRRSLLQGFREHLGIGPMAYIKLHRLHGLRRELLRADPAQVRIGALAAEWGFLNPGHFARDYSRLFGELPRQTLQQSVRLP